MLAAALTGVADLTLPPGPSFTGLTYAEAPRTSTSPSRPSGCCSRRAPPTASRRAHPLPRFVRGFDAWPVPSREATRFFLRSGGG